MIHKVCHPDLESGLSEEEREGSLFPWISQFVAQEELS